MIYIVKSSANSNTSHLVPELTPETVTTMCGAQLKRSTSFTAKTLGQVTCMECAMAWQRSKATAE